MMEFMKYIMWGLVFFVLILIVIGILSFFGAVTVNAESFMSPAGHLL